jgi:hypothetical protein
VKAARKFHVLVECPECGASYRNELILTHPMADKTPAEGGDGPAFFGLVCDNCGEPMAIDQGFANDLQHIALIILGEV